MWYDGGNRKELFRMKKMLAVLLSALLLMAICAFAEEAEPTVYTSGEWEYVLLEDGTAIPLLYPPKEARQTGPSGIE